MDPHLKRQENFKKIFLVMEKIYYIYISDKPVKICVTFIYMNMNDKKLHLGVVYKSMCQSLFESRNLRIPYPELISNEQLWRVPNSDNSAEPHGMFHSSGIHVDGNCLDLVMPTHLGYTKYEG